MKAIKNTKCLIALLIFVSLCMGCSESNDSKKSKQKTDEISQAMRNGRAEQNLGFQSYSLGSQGQATALLSLMENEFEKADYQIFYKTDTIIFGCNFKKDVIIRIHQGSDGHGSQEMWSGYIMGRLQNAANGNSLNDTPEGKKMGAYQSFFKRYLEVAL